jgi:hypothetical protein
VRPKRSVIVATAFVVALAAACSSAKPHVTTATTSGSTTTSATVPVTPLGTGVTATTVKIGIALVDFKCIQQFQDIIRTNQQQVYQDFFNDVNQHGGVAGKQIVPVFHTYCPIQNSQALALCTTFADDDHVFAVMGNFVDFSGDAQTCLVKDHGIILITFDLTQAIMNMSPPGMIILPGSNPERLDSVLFGLLQKEGTLVGKKVAILGETVSEPVVVSSVEPDLKRLGVAMGSTAILTITGADTSAAQSQLDSFIERWKSEHVDTLFVTGDQVASQQFIEKVRGAMPQVTLITDSDVTTYATQEHHVGRRPDPYEGIITVGGPTSSEYDNGPNWAYCAKVYQEQTGQVAPNTSVVIPGPNGKTIDLNGLINDACTLVTLFHDIVDRVGPDLNVPNWVRAVDTFGAVRNMGGGPYASLHAGKYDIDNSFRLREFNSSLPPDGQQVPLTPLQDISG